MNFSFFFYNMFYRFIELEMGFSFFLLVFFGGVKGGLTKVVIGRYGRESRDMNSFSVEKIWSIDFYLVWAIGGVVMYIELGLYLDWLLGIIMFVWFLKISCIFLVIVFLIRGMRRMDFFYFMGGKFLWV